MTYFDLRKRHQDEETEAADAGGESVETEVPDDNAPDASHGFVGALWAGISGPGAWLTAHGRPGLAWLLYAGSAWAAGHYRGWVAFGLVVGWLVAVLAFTPREFLDRVATFIERLGERRHQPRPDDTPDAGEEPLLDPVVTVLWHLIGDAPGAHLKTLTEYLQQAAPEQPVDRAAVRAKLGALGIPLKASVRDAAGRVNEGVHRADLKAWEEALPRPATGTPSEARSNATEGPATCDVGKSATDVAMPFSRMLALWLRGDA